MAKNDITVSAPRLSGLMHTVRAVLTTPNTFWAVRVLSPTEVVRTTVRRYRGRVDLRGSVDLLVKIGTPNYGERLIIKRHVKAGGVFPMRVITKAAPKVRERKKHGRKKRG